MQGKEDPFLTSSKENAREASVINAVACIITGRNARRDRLIDQLGMIMLNDKLTHEEIMYKFFLAIKTEHQKILNSFGGSNSQMARDLADICDKQFGVKLGKDSYAPQKDGFIAKYLKSATNALKMIFEFDTSEVENTGGVTGSVRTNRPQELKYYDKDHQNKEVYYQLKPSIKKNTLLRRAKAGDTDRENFGEVIASFIGRQLADPSKVPEVSLVYDPIDKSMSIASKYLDAHWKVDKYNKGLDTLSGHVEVSKDEAKHVKFVKNNKQNLEKGERYINALTPELRKDLANAIVLSAVVGDHDINPGNMIVATDEHGNKRLARIDFGHAFNDLLNASVFNGGQVRDKKNPILDFFNREEVAGIGGSQSKLWRNYPGFVPSQELTEALKDMAAQFDEKAAVGIKEAKDHFILAFETMKNNNDLEGIQHMKDSLNAICENISGKKVDNNLDADAFSEAAFEKIETFTKDNGKNLTQVANIMQMQVDIDKALIDGEHFDCTRLGDQKGARFAWVKTGPEPAFVGTVGEYLLHRANQLALEEDPKKIQANYNVLKQDPELLPPKKINRTQEFRLKMYGYRDIPQKPSEPTEVHKQTPKMK